MSIGIILSVVAGVVLAPVLIRVAIPVAGFAYIAFVVITGATALIIRTLGDLIVMQMRPVLDLRPRKRA